MNKDEFTFTAGIFIRKKLRQMLESERFEGRDIRWMEDKGWIESVFRVRGDIKAVESRVNRYIKILTRETA